MDIGQENDDLAIRSQKLSNLDRGDQVSGVRTRYQSGMVHNVKFC